MIESHASLSEKFLKKGFWLYLFSFIIAPMWYIVKVIISGELSVSEVWILYGVISLITLISAYNDLGVTESLNHFIPQFVTEKRYDKIKSILFFSFLAQIISWGTIAAFFYFGADLLAENYFRTEAAAHTLKVFAFFFLWINIFQIISTFFIAIQNTFYNKMIDFIRMSFILIFVICVLFLWESSLENFSYAWVVWLYAGIIIAVIVFLKKYFFVHLVWEKIIWDKNLMMSIGKYSGMVFLWAQAGVVLSQMDMQMIIYMLGTQDAGYYTNYLSIVSIPFMIITPIFALLFPVFSELHSKKEHWKIALVKNTLWKNLIGIAIAFNILFFVFGEVIAYILFWEKFLTSGTILQFSILFLVFNFLLQINFNILAWIGRVGKRVQIVCIWIVANFIMNLFLIQFLWVYGAALATAFGWIIIWILSERALGKEYLMNFDFIFIVKNIFISWLLWLVSYLYIVPLFLWTPRTVSFFWFCALSTIYFSFFLLTNKKEVLFFITEIKKLRWNR